MPKSLKTLTLKLSRVIAGTPAKVFDAWMDPKKRCNPWSHGKTLGLAPKAGSVFCILIGKKAYIFGRVLKTIQGKSLQHTWMSSYTRGMESIVTLHFKKHASGTQVILRHSGLPNDKGGSLHAQGWGRFLGMLEGYFAGKK